MYASKRGEGRRRMWMCVVECGKRIWRRRQVLVGEAEAAEESVRSGLAVAERVRGGNKPLSCGNGRLL